MHTRCLTFSYGGFSITRLWARYICAKVIANTNVGTLLCESLDAYYTTVSEVQVWAHSFWYEPDPMEKLGWKFRSEHRFYVKDFEFEEVQLRAPKFFRNLWEYQSRVEVVTRECDLTDGLWCCTVAQCERSNMGWSECRKAILKRIHAMRGSKHTLEPRHKRYLSYECIDVKIWCACIVQWCVRATQGDPLQCWIAMRWRSKLGVSWVGCGQRRVKINIVFKKRAMFHRRLMQIWIHLLQTVQCRVAAEAGF